MAKLPAFQFYPGDWMKDADLRRCSFSAQGVWLTIICIMFDMEDRGVLQTSGVPWSDEDLERAVGGNLKETRAGIAELLAKNVLKKDANGAYFCKRLMDDDAERKAARERQKRHRVDPVTPLSQPCHALVTPLSRRSSSSTSSSSSDKDQEAGGSAEGSAAKALPPIPASLDCANFRAEWVKWLNFRKAKGKPVSPLAAAEQFRLCEELGPDQAVQQIRASIRNDWQGLFRPDRQAKPTAAKPTFDPATFKSGEVEL